MAPSQGISVPTVEEMEAQLRAQRARMENDPEFYKSLVDPHPSGNPMNIGRRIPEPEKLVELQLQGVNNNAAKWLANTTLPKKNFKEEALRPEAQARYKNSMQKVIAENRHAGGMALVNETETMDTIKALGSGVYQNGVTARKNKILRVAKELDSDRLATCATIDAMPGDTDAAREAKMLANKRAMQAIGSKRRSGK